MICNKKNWQTLNVKCLVLMSIGLSGVFLRVVLDVNPLIFISPAPAVFSEKINKPYKTRVTRFKNENGESKVIDNIVLDQIYYGFYDGPHRYKVALLSFIKRSHSIIHKKEYKNFVNHYLCHKNNLEEFKFSKVVIDYSENKNKEFNCSELEQQ